jgi:hypothetical protein
MTACLAARRPVPRHSSVKSLWSSPRAGNHIAANFPARLAPASGVLFRLRHLAALRILAVTIARQDDGARLPAPATWWCVRLNALKGTTQPRSVYRADEAAAIDSVASANPKSRDTSCHPVVRSVAVVPVTHRWPVVDPYQESAQCPLSAYKVLSSISGLIGRRLGASMKVQENKMASVPTVAILSRSRRSNSGLIAYHLFLPAQIVGWLRSVERRSMTSFGSSSAMSQRLWGPSSSPRKCGARKTPDYSTDFRR